MAQTTEEPKATAPPPRIGKQGDPCIMVIFGAAGDLTGRLLIPALYNLARAGLLSKEFAVLGVARAQLSDEEFRKRVYEDIKTYCGECVDSDVWGWFASRFFYRPGGSSVKGRSAKPRKPSAKSDRDHPTTKIFYNTWTSAPNQ